MKKKLVFDWTNEEGEQNDEVCCISLDGMPIIDAAHGPHGWDGMVGIIEALTSVAHQCGWDIEVVGEEGV